MGLFSTTKQIFVSSVVYNLAGGEDDRMDYLKTVVAGAAVGPGTNSIASMITDSYLKGPGIRLRSFGRWARTSGYNGTLGMLPGSLVIKSSVPASSLENLIPHQPEETVTIQTAELGVPDYTNWVDRYMVANHPGILDTEYETDFDYATKVVSITFASGGATETFTIPDYDPAGQYLYVSYNLSTGDEPGPLVTGTTYTLAEGEDFPSVSDWDLMYSSGPDNVYSRTVFLGMVGGSLRSRQDVMLQSTPDTGPRTWRLDTRESALKTYSPLQIFIYRKGSGNPSLDALFATSTSAGTYLPPVPLRIDNAFVSDGWIGDVYPRAKRALKKSIDASFSDLVERIEDNASLNDIDYAFAVFGVSLNTKDAACQRYIYEFFQEIMLGQDLSGTAYSDWLSDWAEAKASVVAWEEWAANQSAASTSDYGSPEPVKLSFPSPPSYTVRVASSRTDLNYDMIVSWNSIQEAVYSGQGRPGAKEGDFWFEDGGSEVYDQIASWLGGEDGGYTYEARVINKTRLYWQTGDDTFRRLEIYGLDHANMVYGGKGVYISARDALLDENESGFIIPLHEEIIKRMPLKESTQLSTTCTYLVFNCYQIVKTQWYQQDWFKIVLIIVVIVIIVYSGGAGAGSVGLLGSNAAVGASLGFTGTAALVAGAVANAVAAMILTQIITKVSTALFGDKLGAIIGVIASMVAVYAGTAMANDQSFASAFGDMMRAENLLKLTSAVGNGYADFIKADTQDVLQRTQQLTADYSAQSKEIEAKYEEVLGGQNGTIMDPLSLTNVSRPRILESSESFLGRTLMTGSDIAGLSLDMLTNFTTITLNTDLPL